MKVHRALLRKLPEPAGQFLDDAFFPSRAVVARSIFGCGEFNAPVLGLLRFFEHLATCSSAFDGMQPRYRHTPPGIRFRINERNFHAEVGRKNAAA